MAEACSGLSQAYEPRTEQQAVAGLIETALSRQETQAVGILPIEAGPGTGKTLAYLVPGALHASVRGSRMLVSTHTIALGTQIMRKDGPIAQAVVEGAIGRKPRLAHMRGRTNFMSPSRARAVGNLLREDGLPSSAWRPYLDLAEIAAGAITKAAIALAEGDVSEDSRVLVETCLLDRMEDEAGVRLSREDVCLLASSPEQELALHRLARALAKEATILVTTHAYTAVALARRALFDAATDSFDILVIDEADQWASAASSVSLLSLSLSELGRTIEAVLQSSRHAKDRQGITKYSQVALDALDHLREMAPKGPEERQPIERDDGTLRALTEMRTGIDRVLQLAGQNRRHTAAAADVLRDRAEMIGRIGLAVSGNETDFWITRWKTSRVQGLPSIDVQGRAPGRILKRLWTAHEGSAPLARTVVLTSATLATPGFKEEARWKAIEIATGADPSSGMVLTDLATSIQPNDFGRLRVRFADPHAPVPRVDADGQVDAEATSYAAAVILAAMEDSRSRKGRTLVLVPSYADVKRLEPLVPGARFHRPDESVQRVLDEYQATKGCCLVTPGAWVGADLPGMVQNLVIPRIPFPPRDDGDEQIVEILSVALCKLAQGIGRAIRKHDDDAILWFADPRMPIPDCITEETGLLSSPSGNAALLGAIPKRFRDNFGRVAGAAAISVPYTGFKLPGHRQQRARATPVKRRPGRQQKLENEQTRADNKGSRH
ncbi:MAG: ATP-dependent helicase DinG [Acetobacteraceae bacterium]|nr:ATP-dependent helicase DinG [Acetobacteraceae bacterium]